MKDGLQLIGVRHDFHMISDNPNVDLGIVDCPMYTRRIEFKDEYHHIKGTYLYVIVWNGKNWKA